MSHEIHENDRFGYVGQKAWHGLGQELPAGLDAQTAFEQLGIGWKTELLPVYAERLTPDGIERIECSENKLHVRADNGQRLGMVSDGYQSFENMDLARFADMLAGEDAAVVVETAGTLYDNRRVFALVKLPQVVRATELDISHQYVLVSNGHGGHASFSVYPTSVRVVCANTLRYSERDVGRGLSFRHTGKFDDKVKAARVVLGTATKETERFQEKVTAMVNKHLTKEKLREFLEQSWEISFGKLKNLQGDSLIKMTAKRDEQVAQWIRMTENERNGLDGIRGSVWSALNAVTEYHDHERGRFKEIGESAGRVHSNLFGVSSVAKQKTLRLALSLAK
jgi:phage/plasmid-like protein (TIGR03299 family)